MTLRVACEVLIPKHPSCFMDAQTHVLIGTEVCLVPGKKNKKSITERELSIAVNIGNGLPLEPSPLCLNVKLKYLRSAHGETFRCCPPLNGCRKEKKKNPLPSGGQARRYFVRFMAFLLNLHTYFLSLFYKRSW